MNIKHLLCLLLFPFAALGTLYGVVTVLNQSAGLATDPVRVRLDRNLSLPWDAPVNLAVTLDLTALPVNKQPPPSRIVVIVDNSDSMTLNIGGLQGSRFSLAKSVLVQFIQHFNHADDVQFGVIFFNDQISEAFPLSTNRRDLLQGIQRFDQVYGGTNLMPPLEQAAAWLANEPNTQRSVIVLTDAELDGIADLRSRNQKQLASHGVDAYMVGIGPDADADVMREILRDEQNNIPVNRVFISEDERALPDIFDQIAREVGNVVGTQGRLDIPLAHKVFHWQSVPASSDPEHPVLVPETDGGPPKLSFPILFRGIHHWSLQLEPLHSGIISPLFQPASFTYRDLEGQTRSVPTPRAPYHLNVTYLLLTLLFLPLLLYLLDQLMQYLRGADPRPVPRTLSAPPPDKGPSLLPTRFQRADPVPQWLPTLVIALGRSGRHVATHLAEALRDPNGNLPEAVKILAVDVAVDEWDGPAAERVPGVLHQLGRDSVYLPNPAERRGLDQLIEAYSHSVTPNADDPFSHLNLGTLEEAERDLIGLSQGTRGHANLARAWLIRELERGPQSSLRQKLEQHINALKPFIAQHQFGQVFLVANPNGGVGAGCFTDLAVFVERLFRSVLQRETRVPVTAVLLENGADPVTADQVPLRNRAFVMEINRLSQTGRLATSHNLARADIEDPGQILRDTLKRRPIDTFLIFARRTDNPERALFPEAADGLLLQMEAVSRGEIAPIMENIKQVEGCHRREKGVEVLQQVSMRSLLYPRALMQRWLVEELVSDLLGSDMLLPGLSLSGTTAEMTAVGSLQDAAEPALLDHYLDRQSAWRTLFYPNPTRRTRLFHEDSDAFLSWLKDGVSHLLTASTWNLTGAVACLHQLEDALQKVDQPQPDEQDALDRAAEALRQTAAALDSGRSCLLGPSTPGDDRSADCLTRLRRGKAETERIRTEMAAQAPQRTHLGLDDTTPKAFQIQQLKQKLLAELFDPGQPYQHLRMRFSWLLTREADNTRLSLAFIGQVQEVIDLADPATCLAAFTKLCRNWVSAVPNLLSWEILGDADSEAEAEKRLQATADLLCRGTDRRALFQCITLPHPDRVVLSTQEQAWLAQLRKRLDHQRAKSLIRLYPASHFRDRLITMEIGYLKTAAPATVGDFLPVHLPELLAMQRHPQIEQFLTQRLEENRALDNRLLEELERFKIFTQFWLAGQVFQDPRDGRWLWQGTHQRVVLTRLPEETLADAALRFVADPNLAQAEPPGPSRDEQRQLLAEDRSMPIFGWMNWAAQI